MFLTHHNRRPHGTPVALFAGAARLRTSRDDEVRITRHIHHRSPSDQLRDFLIREDVRLMPASSAAEEPEWRNLGATVVRTQPCCEPPYHAEPPGPGGTLHSCRLHGPAKRQVDGDELRSLAVQELHELAESHRRFTKLAAERSPDLHILLSTPREGASLVTSHDRPWAGHGAQGAEGDSRMRSSINAHPRSPTPHRTGCAGSFAQVSASCRGH